jgi:hypothetical protein
MRHVERMSWWGTSWDAFCPATAAGAGDPLVGGLLVEQDRRGGADEVITRRFRKALLNPGFRS